MAKDEFEDRERVSPDIYIPPPGQDISRGKPPRGASGYGVPAYPYKVQAVYDARPINGVDWYLPFVLPSFTWESNTVWSAIVSFPLGYVAVLREFSLSVEDATHTPQMNESFYPRFGVWRGSDLGQAVTGITSDEVTPLVPEVRGQVIKQKAFVIVPDGFRLYMNIADQTTIVATDIFRVELYGNLIQTTGLPANFEVGL